MSVSRRVLPPFCTLDRYVLAEFIRYYLLALAGFVGFVLLFDAMEKIDTFIDHSATASQILRYYFYSLPLQTLLVGPVAPLLATFLSLGYMTRFQELTVIKAAGVSLYRVLMPLYALGILLSVGSFFAGEYIMPEANRRSHTIMEQEIKNRTMKSLGSRINVTYLGDENRLYIIRRYDIPRETMTDATIQEFDGERMSRRIDAVKGVYADGVWTLIDGVERTFSLEGVETAVPFDSLRAVFPERPADFAKEDTRPEEMSYRELRLYAERVRQSGSNVAQYETEMNLRLAFPLVNFVVILIGSSLAVQLRRGGVALGFGFSLAIAFAYWTLIRSGQVLGNNGTLPPELAAWLGNIVFVAVGLWMLYRTPK
jgi:lipopolysaccharide export system permease protein